MLSRFIKFSVLVLLLSMPLYASRKHSARAKPAAATAAEHRADLERVGKLPKNAFLVTGQGAPRALHSDCYRDIPAFRRLLAAKGLTPLEPVRCVRLEGDDDSYAPVFRAASPKELEMTMLTGSRYNSASFCQLEAERLSADYSRQGITALESGCRRAPALNASSAADELFEPVVILLAPPAGPVRAKASLEELARAAQD